MRWREVGAVAVATASLGMCIAACQVRRGPPQPQGNRSASHEQGLTILASGARRFELVDPLGRRMLRDVRTQEIISGIPGASIEGLASEHDSGEDLEGAFSGYDLDIPMAVDGHYTFRVDADGGLSMSVTAYGDSGVFASEAAVDTTVGLVSSSYDILYSGVTRSLTIKKTGIRRQR